METHNRGQRSFYKSSHLKIIDKTSRDLGLKLTVLLAGRTKDQSLSLLTELLS